jgi:WD40 repeat protein
MSMTSSFVRTNWKTKATITKFEFKTLFSQPSNTTQVFNPPIAQSLDCHKEGNRAAVGLGNGKCILFDLNRKGVDSVADVLDNHEYSVHQVAFMYENERPILCTAGLDDKLLIWDVAPAFEQKEIPSKKKKKNGAAKNTPTERSRVLLRYDHMNNDKRMNCIAVYEKNNIVFVGDESSFITAVRYTC